MLWWVLAVHKKEKLLALIMITLKFLTWIDNFYSDKLMLDTPNLKLLAILQKILIKP